MSSLTGPPAARLGRWLPAVVLVAAGLAAYHNSFTGAFLMDDGYLIVENAVLREPLRSWKAICTDVRPVVTWTLAANFALAGDRGLDVWGYHAFNLVVHLLAGLTLYGLVRRTLLLHRYRGRYEGAAPWLALAAALVWLVHPLQTESVTYIIQRSESLMGLCYLLTLYGVLRGATAARGGLGWYVLAVIACLVGMGSKEVMVTAPLLALLYDRTFLGDSWREVWRRRRGLYAALAATWVALAVPLQAAFGLDQGTGGAGFGVKGVTPGEYALSQPGVLVHYLRLSAWPQPLCLDYAWPVATTAAQIVPPALVIAGLLLATLWAWRRWPALAFLGTAFFLILALTSSVLPLLDLAVEHRMYLPLAAVVVFAVLGVHAGISLLERRRLLTPTGAGCLAVALVVGAAGLLAARTVRRNEDYRSELAMWGDVVAQRPDNPRGHTGLGAALLRSGAVDPAIAQCEWALALKPDDARAHYNLGYAFALKGDAEQAVAHYREAVRLRPGFAEAHHNLGQVLAGHGKTREAVEEVTESLRLNPYNAPAHRTLAVLLERQGDLDGALARYREEVRIDPDSAEGHYHAGHLLARQGKLEEAADQFAEAVRLRPGFAAAQYGLGVSLAGLGRLDEAVRHYAEAARLRPDDPAVHNGWGLALARLGRPQEAGAQFSEAVRLAPDDAPAHNNLAQAFAQQGQLDLAIFHYREAVRANPGYALAHNNLGSCLLQRGRLDEAVGHFTAALRTQPDFALALDNLGTAYALQEKRADALACFRRAVKLQPGVAKYWFDLAHALREAGQNSEAEADYQQGLRLDPHWPRSANRLAWTLATHPNEAARNGRQALWLAEQACEATGYREVGYVDTLAAAYAEAGRFPDAQAAARQALALVSSAAPSDGVRRLQERLRLYERREPFRDTAGAGTLTR
jgi:Flp pilus assembly protein TadD